MTEFLYHYTSLEGLLSILQGKHVWATDISYLNDSSEFEHMLKDLLPLLDERDKKSANRCDATASMHLRQALTALQDQRPPTFVFSMSEDGDQLGQWRGYCPPTGGVSIGFRRSVLEQFAKSGGFTLERCRYNKEKQTSKLRRSIDAVYEKLADHEGTRMVHKNTPEHDVVELASQCGSTNVSVANLPEVDAIAMQLWRAVLHWAPFRKHPAFSEEREWRIVCQDGPKVKTEAKFRPGKGLVIPYFPIGPLPTDAIAQIFVGPCPHPKLAQRSLQDALKTVTYFDTDVLLSEIPYRNW